MEMKEITNNGIKVTKPTGCWLCKNLDFFESDFESNDESGWCCHYRDVDDIDNFKDFPCKRRLKCFIPDLKLMETRKVNILN